MKTLKVAALLMMSGLAWADVGSIITIPGGSTGSVQVNKRGQFYGDSNLVYSTSTHVLAAPGISITTLISNGQTYTFPSAQTGGSFLTTDGAGGLSWATPSVVNISSGVNISVFDGAVQVSTAIGSIVLNGAQFIGTLSNGTEVNFALDSSSVTLLGQMINIGTNTNLAVTAPLILTGSTLSVNPSSVTMLGPTIDLGTEVTGTAVAANLPATVVYTNTTQNISGFKTFTSSLTAASLSATSLTDSGLTSGQCVQTTAGGLLTTSGAQCGTGVGGASTLQVMQSGVQITSPTSSINFDGNRLAVAQAGSTATVTLASSFTVTAVSASTGSFANGFYVDPNNSAIWYQRGVNPNIGFFNSNPVYPIDIGAQTNFRSTMNLGGLPGTSGQCLKSQGAGFTDVWSDCSSGSGGSGVDPSTFTKTFPYGISVTTITLSSASANQFLKTGPTSVVGTTYIQSSDLPTSVACLNCAQTWTATQTLTSSMTVANMLLASSQTVAGQLVVSGVSADTTSLNITGGNLGLASGGAIVVQPGNIWTSGQHRLIQSFYNGFDDQVDIYSPGNARTTPIMTLRSLSGAVGIGTTNPSKILDVVGTGAFASTGTTPALSITANGTYGTVNGASGGLFMDCSGGANASGNCVQLYSSAGAQNALGGMLNIVNNSSAWNEPAIYTQRLSNTNNNSDIRIEATGTPAITIIETGQTVGSGKKFQVSAHGGTMRFEGRNTSDNAFDSAIIISSQATYGDVAIGQGYNPATNTQLQVITSTSNTYAVGFATTAVGGNSVTISTSMGMTFNNTNDGNISLTIGGSTYTVTSSSGGYTVGQLAVFSSTSGSIVGINSGAGLPSGASGTLQYNNLGAFGSVTGTVVTASSITIPYTVVNGSVTILSGTGASGNAVKGMLDIYGQSLPAGTPLLSVGSSSQGSSFYVLSNQMPNAGALGLTAGFLAIGDITNSWGNRIYATGDNTQFFDLRTGSTMTFQTSTANGQGNMLFNAGSTVPVFKISKFTGVSVSSSAASGSYLLKISTMGIISVSSNTPVLSGCGTGPSVRGNSYRFQITGGTGATGCVATFPGGTFVNNAPMCSVDQSTVSTTNALTHTETTSAITITQTGLGTGVLTVSCVGFNE